MSQKTASVSLLSPQSSSCSAKGFNEDSENDFAIGNYDSDMVSRVARCFCKKVTQNLAQSIVFQNMLKGTYVTFCAKEVAHFLLFFLLFTYIWLIKYLCHFKGFLQISAIKNHLS
jgi:hypothetical protein